MRRRDMLKATMASLWMNAFAGVFPARSAGHAHPKKARPRPGEPGWPSAADWERLNRDVDGRLVKLEPPFAACAVAEQSAACAVARAGLRNPFYVGDQPGLTQTSGWIDAWSSEPSVYAVGATTTADVVAAVNFARDHDLRIVIKGGGHSYQGTSSAADSLLIWTRRLNAVTLHDAFVPEGCDDRAKPSPAVSLGAGAMWADAYHAVTTLGGRYVQGGGCTTVGVAGLVQSGGFGSFSKCYGTAAAGLLEAEIVTADGHVRIANACTHPDLFWAIKGGGGGSFGVVTRLTLRTRELPAVFGAVFGRISAATDAAHRALVAEVLAFYARSLFNPHWGEQLVFERDNSVRIAMVFQGLAQSEAEAVWAPFIDWVQSRGDCTFTSELKVVALPARHFWDAEFLRQHAAPFILSDDRPGAPREHFLWRGDAAQCGWFLHGYQSVWIPASLLSPRSQSDLTDAIIACARQWEVALHVNKGLAGAPAEAIDAAHATAMNPDAVHAFALAILGAEGPPAYPGLPDALPDLDAARADAVRIRAAAHELKRFMPTAGSYPAESDYFESQWQKSFWGSHYPRLTGVKRRYDPTGLFFAHHAVGSESWSADGFTRIGA